MTQKDLAEKAGLPQPNLSNIEKGKQDITVTTLRKIAHALEMRPAEFFEEDDDRKKARLSRPMIEKLAKAIAGKKVSLTEKETAVASLFDDILPGKNKSKVRIQKMRQSWLELRKRLHPEEITALCQRIREMEKL